MEHSVVNSLIEKLNVLYGEDSQTVFPYEDCRILINKFGKRYQDLTADLNVYFMDLAGYCSWGKKIANWPEEKVREVRKKQSKPFFDKYPQYKPLQSVITTAETPDLYLQMTRYEEMRMTLRKVLFLLAAQQERNRISKVTVQEINVVPSA